MRIQGLHAVRHQKVGHPALLQGLRGVNRERLDFEINDAPDRPGIPSP